MVEDLYKIGSVQINRINLLYGKTKILQSTVSMQPRVNSKGKDRPDLANYAEPRNH